MNSFSTNRSAVVRPREGLQIEKVIVELPKWLGDLNISV